MSDSSDTLGSPSSEGETHLRGWRRAAWLGTAMLSAGVALLSCRYVVHVGMVPPNIAANRFVQPWIVVLAGGAATALLVGPLQLLPMLRQRSPRLHRWLGRTYVAGCAAGGVAAMVLAAGTIAGPVAALGFVSLDLGWLATTGLGMVAAILVLIEVYLLRCSEGDWEDTIFRPEMRSAGCAGTPVR